MKQNKKNVAVFLAVVVLFSSLSLPALAYTDTSSNGVDFSDQPIPYSDSVPSNSDIRSNGFYVANSFINGSYYIGGSDNIYVFFVLNSNSSDVYFVSDSSTLFYEAPSNNNSIVNTFNISNLDSSSGLYYSTAISGKTSKVTDYPLFSSFESGISAVSEWVDNLPVTVTPHPINYSIPAGYVAYFEIPSNETIRASVTTTSGVPLTPAQWASTNVLYGYSSSLPSGAFTLPITGSTSFSWNTGKTNLFGKSQHWSWLGTINTSSKYYFISNPTYSNVVGTNSNGSSMIVDNPSATNGYVDVYLSSVIDVKLFPLKSTITYDPSIGAYGGIDDGASGESYSVGYDDTTGQWVTTDPSGNPVGVGGVPIGGDNSIDSIPTSDTIVDWLENIARTIGAFFRGAVGAVTTLVSAGSDFIHSLVGLYSWLPSSVYAVLSSALVLVIVIGVIKVFV